MFWWLYSFFKILRNCKILRRLFHNYFILGGKWISNFKVCLYLYYLLRKKIYFLKLFFAYSSFSSIKPNNILSCIIIQIKFQCSLFNVKIKIKINLVYQIITLAIEVLFNRTSLMSETLSKVVSIVYFLVFSFLSWNNLS